MPGNLENAVMVSGCKSMNMVNRIHRFIEDLPVYWFIPCITVVSYVAATLVANIATPWLGPMGAWLKDEELWLIIPFAVLVAPLIETVIFQSLPIHLLIRIRVPRIYIAVVSAVFFGVCHDNSLTYMVVIFVDGLFLAYAYLMYLPKPQSAFLVVSAIHMLNNIIAVGVRVVLLDAG